MTGTTTFTVDWSVVWPILLLILAVASMFLTDRRTAMIIGGISMLGFLLLLTFTSPEQWVAWGQLIVQWWPISTLVIVLIFIAGLASSGRK